MTDYLSRWRESRVVHDSCDSYDSLYDSLPVQVWRESRVVQRKRAPSTIPTPAMWRTERFAPFCNVERLAGYYAIILSCNLVCAFTDTTAPHLTRSVDDGIVGGADRQHEGVDGSDGHSWND